MVVQSTKTNLSNSKRLLSNIHMKMIKFAKENQCVLVHAHISFTLVQTPPLVITLATLIITFIQLIIPLDMEFSSFAISLAKS